MNKAVVGKTRTRQRMQSIECFRLIFSFIVVIAHCITTDNFGLMMNTLGWVVVPFFFVVSGYFSYHARERSLRKRFWSVVKLTIGAHLLYMLWDGYLSGIRDVGSMVAWCLDKCSSKTLMTMLLISKSPISSHLWYLNASVICYGAMWLYGRWTEGETCDYKPLYIMGVCLYSLHVVLASFATASEFAIPHYLYRNGLLYGLPMFILGIFLREYNEKIIRVYNLTKIKLVGLFAAGALLIMLQMRGTGKVEMPLGALVEVIALILLCVMVPVVSKNSGIVSGMISTFGTLSTYIYVTHMVWLDIYSDFLKGYALQLGETVEEFLYPAIVVGLSLFTGILYMGLKSAVKWLAGKVKMAGRVNNC